MSCPPNVTTFIETSRARALRAWSQAQQDEVRDLLHRLLRDWQKAWALVNTAGPSVPPTVQAASQAPADMQAVLWCFEEAPGTDAVQMALRVLQTALFGDTAHLATVSGGLPVIAPEITRVAWSDWHQRLESALGVPLSTWPSGIHADDIWSGALHAQLGWCGLQYTLLIPGPVVQKLVQPQPPAPVTAPSTLAPLADALHDQGMDVRARLHDVTLTLGELEHLCPGDVVLLSHRLETPLLVHGPDDRALCTAWLGQQSGRIALELSPLAIPA